MSEEIHELHEHAEEAHHDRTLAPVTVTMAVLAVLVATLSLLGHRTHTEELLLQNRSTDRWAQYQAKSIRRHNYDMFTDLLSVSAVRDAEAASKMRERYAREVERYREDQKELDAEARKLEAETALDGGVSVADLDQKLGEPHGAERFQVLGVERDFRRHGDVLIVVFKFRGACLPRRMGRGASRSQFKRP